MNKNISHFAVHFPSTNPEELAAWYRDFLGFEITFKWGDPVEYVVTNREERVSIHFTKVQSGEVEPCSIYIFCENVDALYAEFRKNGVVALEKPSDRDYGMRDFDLRDPVGHRITFGKSLAFTS